MDFPKDMMEELLLGLPLKAITKFKCVSKYWNNLISGAEFRRWYQSRHRSVSPNGLVYHPIRHGQGYAIEIEPAKFLCTSNINKEEFYLCHDLQELGEVVGSSKGLLLLNHYFFLTPSPFSYYVYDLLTRNHVQLPKTRTRYNYVVNGFICREHEQNASKSIIGSSSYLTYKVVVIGWHYQLEKKATYEVETYSSETGKWNKSVMTTASEFNISSRRYATVIGDVLYWKNYDSNNIIAYDPENPTGRAKLIGFPILEYCRMVTISGTQDGCLLFIADQSRRQDIEVWGLAKEKYFDEDIIKRGRWNLLHKISSMELRQSLLDFRPVEPAFIECADIHPQDSRIIILRMADEFILYNLNDKRVETIILKGDGEESIFGVREYLRFEHPKWPCLY